MTLLLHSVQSPINTGMVLRVAETFEIRVALVGAEGLLGDPARCQTMSDFACGALQRKGVAAFDRFGAVIAAAGRRRIVATSILPGTSELPDFKFQAGDIVVLGNEYDGLPADVAAAATCALRIPMAEVWTPKPPSASPIDPARAGRVTHDGMPNLNVAMAAGIICYQWFVRTTRDA